ncbi:hypothetical protein, partial [Xanthomonas arboricola]|uniref:hypothetical protein n=1 Tax=Xanthomonas arboricola TaxID=56448 RepID=UPI001CBDB8D3
AGAGGGGGPGGGGGRGRRDPPHWPTTPCSALADAGDHRSARPAPAGVGDRRRTSPEQTPLDVRR